MKSVSVQRNETTAVMLAQIDNLRRTRAMQQAQASNPSMWDDSPQACAARREVLEDAAAWAYGRWVAT